MEKVAQIAERPWVVCLCGSTRFYEVFQALNLQETLAGRIVFSIGCDTKSDGGLGLSQGDKERLDELHLRKIDLADEILVINVAGYVGSSTSREIVYAWDHGKGVRWWSVPPYPAWHNPFPDDGGSCCEYTRCLQEALWRCDDGKAGLFFCSEHVFLFGYPVPMAPVSVQVWS